MRKTVFILTGLLIAAVLSLAAGFGTLAVTLLMGKTVMASASLGVPIGIGVFLIAAVAFFGWVVRRIVHRLVLPMMR